MIVAEYIVNRLIEYGVTDAFGIPGGVVLRLIEALDNRKPSITPHLCYHEQMAGFAACGYAQASGKLGVAYATRGPGILNMVTSIAEAYQEGLPVLFITAHGTRTSNELRFEYNQELDVVSACEKFTKFSANIDSLEDISVIFEHALQIALTGRKGPVLLDISASLFNKEMVERIHSDNGTIQNSYDLETILCDIGKRLTCSNRPLVLIGDGLRFENGKEKLIDYFARHNIPIVSSRGSQDLAAYSTNYFGYIGSHGIRYANFILSKADLVIAIGNRLAYPTQSESFAPVFQHATLIRVDIDDKEFLREIPGSINYHVDASVLGEAVEGISRYCDCDFDSWMQVCREIKDELIDADCTQPVEKLSNFMRMMKDEDVTYVCDVGNNEFWASRAYEKERPNGQMLCSKSFGTLGVAIGRAIGVYYATRKRVICIIGDQGFQYNVQELQYISQWNLPICIVVINNKISGMISDHEQKVLKNRIHVSWENGYKALDLKKIAQVYNIVYDDKLEAFVLNKPSIYEVSVQHDIVLTPNLKKGYSIQNMTPQLERTIYERLNAM